MFNIPSKNPMLKLESEIQCYELSYKVKDENIETVAQNKAYMTIDPILAYIGEPCLLDIDEIVKNEIQQNIETIK